MEIVFVGAGNLATHLSQALRQAGHRIVQVYSRTSESASQLALLLGCPWTTEIEQITDQAQVYVFSVTDTVLSSLSASLYTCLSSKSSSTGKGADGLFIHTAGSMPMDVLPSPRRGVFYPMQTFTKNKPVDFRSIPLFIESNTDASLLEELARQVSSNVYQLDSSTRQYLHLAAVFACNFSNHMYDLSARILGQHNIPFSVMYPLIEETVAKVHHMDPHQAQTGPAVRYDRNVIQRHLSLLSDERMRAIYQLISDNIHETR